jgi:hypothetical protein
MTEPPALRPVHTEPSTIQWLCRFSHLTLAPEVSAPGVLTLANYNSLNPLLLSLQFPGQRCSLWSHFFDFRTVVDLSVYSAVYLLGWSSSFEVPHLPDQKQKSWQKQFFSKTFVHSVVERLIALAVIEFQMTVVNLNIFIALMKRIILLLLLFVVLIFPK